MHYIPRNGIILTSVCDKHLLVSAKENREFIPKVTEINETAANIWNLLQEGKTEDEIAVYLFDHYEIEDYSDLTSIIRQFINVMHDKGYLIEE